MNKRIFKLYIICLLCIISIAGCSIDSRGTLNINIGTEQGSRTITPDSEKLKISSYVVYGFSGSNSIKENLTDKSIVLEVEEGKWSFYADGLNSEGEVIASSKAVNINIVKYKDCEITLQLEAVTDGDGVFSFRLGIPKDATDLKTINCSFKSTANGVADHSFSFDFYTEGEIVDDYSYFSKSITVPSGSYDMCVTTINSIGEEFGIPINESVHVYGGEESKFEHVWSMAYFPLVEAKINDGRGIYVVPKKSCIVELSSDKENVEFFYTLNGDEPDRNSSRYTGKISVAEGTTMKVKACIDGWSRGITTSFTATKVGPAGGYIFYDCDADNTESDPDGPDNLISSDCGWRFLESAKEDFKRCMFGYYVPKGTSEIVGTETAIGTGKSNTEKLVAFMDINGKAYSDSSGTSTAEYAAKKCLDYSYGGYEDWFLPSLEELTQMQNNLNKNWLGSFDQYRDNRDNYYYYWSSSENNSSEAYTKAFSRESDGYSFFHDRHRSVEIETSSVTRYYQVRAVRAF